MMTEEKSFFHTGFHSPINEISLAIGASYQNKIFYASGTAVIIGPGLAITAQHVIADLFRKFEGSDMNFPANSEIGGSFHLQLIQIIKSGKSALIWNVTRLWSSIYTDIAVLRLSPHTKEAQNYKWKSPSIDLIPPNVGEEVACFGYRNPSLSKDGEEIEWGVDPRTSIGQVQEIHYEKRDSVRLNFPCFRTNARFDGSMSGGSVLKKTGKLCGIICSNLPPSDDDEGGRQRFLQNPSFST